MLSACMQHHWEYCQDIKIQPENSNKRPAFYRANATEEHWITPEGMPAVPLDPPPLDDNLAKHIVYVMSRFIYKVGILEERDHGLVANHSASVDSVETFTDEQSLSTCIYKAASKVIAYVSASNWNIIFAKIKNRILYLTTTTEENPEITDVILLECASLNCTRLSKILTGKKRIYKGVDS